MPKNPKPKKKVASPKKEKAPSSSTRWRAFEYGPGAFEDLNRKGYPWRAVEFQESPKALGTQDGWTATAEFTFPVIPRTVLETFQKPWGPVTCTKEGKLAHQWEPIGITMSKRGWGLWGKLNQQDRMEILHALTYWPVKNQFFKRKNRPRGKHTLPSRICWYSSQFVGEVFLDWAKNSLQDDPVRGLVTRKLKACGFKEPDFSSPKDIAALLVLLNWLTAAKQLRLPQTDWPKGLQEPWHDSAEFFKKLFKHSLFHKPGAERMYDQKESAILVQALLEKKRYILMNPFLSTFSSPSGFPEPFIPRKPHHL